MDCGHTVGILAVMAGFLCEGAVGIGIEEQEGRRDGEREMIGRGVVVGRA